VLGSASKHTSGETIQPRKLMSFHGFYYIRPSSDIKRGPNPNDKYIRNGIPRCPQENNSSTSAYIVTPIYHGTSNKSGSGDTTPLRGQPRLENRYGQ